MMIEGIKCNFKNNFEELMCPLQCNLTHTDSQVNLLICPQIKERIDTTIIKYNFLFSDITNQHKAVQTFKKILKIREGLLKENNIA